MSARLLRRSVRSTWRPSNPRRSWAPAFQTTSHRASPSTRKPAGLGAARAAWITPIDRLGALPIRFRPPRHVRLLPRGGSSLRLEGVRFPVVVLVAALSLGARAFARESPEPSSLPGPDVGEPPVPGSDAGAPAEPDG